MKPVLRFPKPELRVFAARYQYPVQETTVLGLKETVAKRGWLTKDDLRTVAQWKAPRSAGTSRETDHSARKSMMG